MGVVHQLKRKLATAVGSRVDLDQRIVRKRGRYVLCYHRVIETAQAASEWVHDSMWISPETFEEQIRWMRSVGTIVDHDVLLDFSKPNSRPLFALTFDDGWRDNYDHAFPIMRRHGVVATIFLATSCMDDGRLIWTEDLTIKTAKLSGGKSDAEMRALIVSLAPQPAALPQRASIRHLVEIAVEQLKNVEANERDRRIGAYCKQLGASSEPLLGHMLTWDQVGEMARAGMKMGSHTHTHRIFSMSTPEEIEQELHESANRINSRLGSQVDSFAYPNARYHGSEGPILAKCGYRSAFRIHNLPVTSTSDPFYVPRLIGNEDTCGSAEYFKLRLLDIY